ncbi:MAG: nuclear transport factor 2 family protein [Halobacteriales archaeon]|nr:nuclear transport factor 2 family protein [Halobacteriales archaeon]
MPEVNAQRIRDYYDYIDAEDLDSVFALFADDIVYHRPGQPSLDGMDAFKQFYREDRPLSEGEHTVESLTIGENTVAVRGRFEGKQDGERVAFGFADHHRFDDEGQITERWTYTDTGAV